MTRTILIVDDDPMIRKLIATTLEDISGYRLQEAGDGMEAVERAQATRPEIVFLDIDMPRLNGIETCCSCDRNAGSYHSPGSTSVTAVRRYSPGGSDRRENRPLVREPG